jgi:micrococcal nuclease
MGKIVRFDTFQAIKDAAARAEARGADPLARLDQRVADMDSAYEARKRIRLQRPSQRKSVRRYHQRAVWNPSGITIFNIAMLAFVGFWFLPDFVGLKIPALHVASAATTDSEHASFSFCHTGGGTNCVVDGDTIWYGGDNIRIADIDTPETHPPRCAAEARLGAAATQRLQSLLNAGNFSIQNIDRNTDVYGRQLRVLKRGGQSIGGMLVNDGLARWYGSGRRSWC